MAIIPLSLDAGNFRVGEVSYNGVRFPPAIHSTASFEPVYDDSGRMVKYVRLKLHIESYMFSGCLGTDATGALVAGSAVSVEHLSFTTDSTLETLADRLTEPCQKLIFSYQGAGDITLNDVNGPLDVDNGPKPKIVDWKPLTNKMARVVWECEAAYAPCLLRPFSSTDIAQFPFTVELKIGETGLSVRTISGSLEIPLTRKATTTTTNPPTGNGVAGGSYPFQMKSFEERIIRSFPPLKQFKRSESFKLSNDRKTVEFSIVDTEINSDDAFGVGCSDEQVTISTSSSLDEGFGIWNTTLSGSIKVLPGYSKAYVGTAEMLRLFHKYYTDSITKGKKSPEDPVTNRSESSDPKNYGIASRGILQSMEFSDDVFGRSINFSISWLVFSTLETIFAATNMFRKIEPDWNKRDRAWEQWAISMSDVIGYGHQELGFNQNDDIIVSMCNPFSQGSSPTGEIPGNIPQPKPDKKFKEAKDLTAKEAAWLRKHSYLIVSPVFGVEVKHGTLKHPPLKSSTPAPEKVTPTPWEKVNLELDGDSSSISDPNRRTIVHKIRDPSYVLTFSGMIVRLHYAPTVPHISSYGGRAVYPIGTDVIIPKKLTQGIDIISGKTYALHGLIWQKRYALQAPPNSSIIESDGLRDLYSIG